MNRRDSSSGRSQFHILDQPVELRVNAQALLAEHRSYLLLLLVTVLLDALSTVAFMSVIGPGAEQNPVVRYLSHHLGILTGPPIGKLFQLIAAVGLALLTPRLTRFIFVTVILLNLLAFVVNMHVFALAG